jgi:hypothetical protein
MCTEIGGGKAGTDHRINKTLQNPSKPQARSPDLCFPPAANVAKLNQYHRYISLSTAAVLVTAFAMSNGSALANFLLPANWSNSISLCLSREQNREPNISVLQNI